MGSLTINTKSKTKTKAKAAMKAEIDEAKAALSAKVDEIITIDKKMGEFKELAKRSSELKGIVLSTVEADYEAAAPIIVKGSLGKLKWTPKSIKRTITDIKKIHEMLGDETFYKICSVGLTDLDKYMTPAEKEKVLKSEQTGSRSVTILPNDD